MTKYVISFDDGAMTFPEEEGPAVGEAAARGGPGGSAARAAEGGQRTSRSHRSQRLTSLGLRPVCQPSR
jgi:hypothetical protein